MTPRLPFVRSLVATLCGAALAFAPLPLAAQSAQPAAKGAPAKELIAVLDMEGANTEPVQASALTERLREELLNSGRFTLVDRAQINAVLAEQALQQTGCTSQECAVQVGKVLGVRKIVSGRVTKLEDTLWLLSATLVDVETAETQRAVSEQHDGNFRTLLAVGIARLAAKIAQGGPAAPAVAAQLPPPPPAVPLAQLPSPPPAVAAQLPPPPPAVPLAQLPSPPPAPKREEVRTERGGSKPYWWILGAVAVAIVVASSSSKKSGGGTSSTTGGVSYSW
jgi:TolB-like protein